MIELEDLLPPPVLKRQLKVKVDSQERWIWMKESTYQKLMILMGEIKK